MHSVIFTTLCDIYHSLFNNRSLVPSTDPHVRQLREYVQVQRKKEREERPVTDVLSQPPASSSTPLTESSLSSSKGSQAAPRLTSPQSHFYIGTPSPSPSLPSSPLPSSSSPSHRQSASFTSSSSPSAQLQDGLHLRGQDKPSAPSDTTEHK